MKISVAAKAFGALEWSHVRGEISEVWEAVRNRDLGNLREEVSDVACFVQVMLHRKTGWDFPMCGGTYSAKKFLKRLQTWQEIFEKEGLWFSPKYLVNGGNHQKPEKVRMALEMARKEQG